MLLDSESELLWKHIAGHLIGSGERMSMVKLSTCQVSNLAKKWTLYPINEVIDENKT